MQSGAMASHGFTTCRYVGGLSLGLADGTALANWHSRFDKVQATTSEIADEPLSDSGLGEMSQAAKISRSTLWRWLLPVLLAALMIENMMANRRLNVRRDGS